MTPFTLHIPTDVEGQLRKCRASIRSAIRQRLKDIVGALAPSAGAAAAVSQGPPLRFYVFEGYRVSYQINPVTRRVVVLTLQAETA